MADDFVRPDFVRPRVADSFRRKCCRLAVDDQTAVLRLDNRDAFHASPLAQNPSLPARGVKDSNGLNRGVSTRRWENLLDIPIRSNYRNGQLVF